MARQTDVDRARMDVPARGEREAARFAEKALVAETGAFAAVRASQSAATLVQLRTRRIDMASAIIGAIGMAGNVAVAIPLVIPYDYHWHVWIVSILLSVIPLGRVIRLALRDEQRPEIVFTEDAAKARAFALFAGRLGQALATASPVEACDPRQSLYGVVDGLESDLATITRSTRPVPATVRRHKRIVPRQSKVIVKTRDGRSLVGNLADVSLSGAALSERLPRLDVGDKVTIGSRKATVARAWDGGMGLEFEVKLDPAAFNEDVVL